jgi:Surface-adhesin protein E
MATLLMAKSLLTYCVMKRERGATKRRAVIVFLLNVLIVCLLSSPGHASEWCFVASSKNYYYYVDSESTSVYGKNVTFWIVQQDIETGKVLYKKQFTINCEDETVALREALRFGFTGAVKDLFSDERYDDWVEIQPLSKMHAVQNVLCCDSKPRQNIEAYLQRTTVKKGEFRASSDVLPNKN